MRAVARKMKCPKSLCDANEKPEIPPHPNPLPPGRGARFDFFSPSSRAKPRDLHQNACQETHSVIGTSCVTLHTNTFPLNERAPVAGL